MDRRAYLRPDVLFEPLFNQWFALFPLLPPTTAAMVLVQSHLKILKSFVEAPRQHARAVADPKMAGGPFVNISESRAAEVRALLERTVKQNMPAIEFVRAVWVLDDLLTQRAKGGSMEPLYKEIPAPLRGLVELTYDLRHSPSIRFIEGLVYQSPVYRREAQTVALSLTSGEERPFVMSTPRLEDAASLHLPIRFDDEVLDALFRARRAPVDVEALGEQLGVPAAKSALFHSFFTSVSPPPPPRFDGPGARIRFFGHACVLLESRQTAILVDPLISYSYPAQVPRYTYQDLPERLDYVVLTHHHADHLVLECLLQLRHKVGTVVVPKANGKGLPDPSMAWALRKVGFKDVRELEELESVSFADGAITGAPFLGEHCDLDVRSKLAHHIRLGGISVVAATDSNALAPEMYQGVRDALGPTDVLLLGTESEGAAISYGYGNFFSRPVSREIDQTRRQNGSNSQSAIAITERLGPRVVQNYAMGLEPWLKHLFPVYYQADSPQLVQGDLYLAWCRAQGITAGRPFGREELHLLPESRGR
jgi:L-ascorbate metabolism protein UlaG (beta-lactamase superfamily)